MARLRLAFMGTPDFAVPSLRALADAGHEIACVYSQPPRPSGRGHAERPSPVHRLACERGWPVRTPASLRDPDEQRAFAALDLDAAVVVAYGLILPTPILKAPRLGCLNVHASLLPRWRGAAPIQRAIEAGDRETGVTIMQMDEGLDTGAIVLRDSTPITSETTAGDLHDVLADLGARLVVEALDGLASGQLAPRAQAGEATYAGKIVRDELRIDWRRPAEKIACKVRAFAPRPGAWFEAGGQRIRVLSAEPAGEAAGGSPGEVLAANDGLVVACGEGALRLREVQRQGKAPMAAADFLRGFALDPGTVLS